MSLALAAILAASTSAAATVEAYLERFFATFPSKATEAGRSDRDRELEDLTPVRLQGWLAFNRETGNRLRPLLQAGGLDLDDRLDVEAVLAQAESEIHRLGTRRAPSRDPLFWTGLLGNATVFQLVRDALPLEERARQARERVRQIPRLAAQARAALVDTTLVPPELCPVAARQARASAQFYREGWPRLAPGARKDGEEAAHALEELAAFLDDLAKKAMGSVRLGAGYAENFRVGTGVEESVDGVLARAEAELLAKRQEAAAYGRSVWKEVVPGQTAPGDDKELLSPAVRAARGGPGAKRRGVHRGLPDPGGGRRGLRAREGHRRPAGPAHDYHGPLSGVLRRPERRRHLSRGPLLTGGEDPLLRSLTRRSGERRGEGRLLP